MSPKGNPEAPVPTVQVNKAHKQKQVMLGAEVRNLAGHNPSYGKQLDKLPHHSAARDKMASNKGKKK